MPRDRAAPPAARSSGAEIAHAASTKFDSSANSPNQRNQALPPSETPDAKKCELFVHAVCCCKRRKIQLISLASPE